MPDNNTMEAHVKGYKPASDQPGPDGLITIKGWFDRDTATMKDVGHDEWHRLSQAKFVRDAEAIYEVLSKNLPGGTLHQLMIAVLKGHLNLHTVLDEPVILPDRLNIEKLAVGYVHEAGNWGVFKDQEADNYFNDPWSALCRAVEAKYGEPPEVVVPIPDEIAQLIYDFEIDNVYIKDDEGRQVTALMASTDVPGLLLIQVDEDNSEWYLVKKKELRIVRSEGGRK